MAAAAASARRLSKLLSPSLLRPLASTAVTGSQLLCRIPAAAPFRRLLSSQSSQLKDPNLKRRYDMQLAGCDYQHWLIFVDKPPGDDMNNPDMPRDEIIEGYIQTLATVVGSEEEARKKIYSVSTRCYFAFGALISEDLASKLKEVPNVRWVLADAYVDVVNQKYSGEPFVNGEAVPYDPKYHEAWIAHNKWKREISGME